MHRTIAEKILQSKTYQKITGPGQIVRCKLSLVLANDITSPLAIKSSRKMGAAKVFDKEKVVSSAIISRRTKILTQPNRSA